MTTALEGDEGSASRPSHSLPREDPLPIVQEAGWAPGPVWTGVIFIIFSSNATTCSYELRGFPPACGDSVADF